MIRMPATAIALVRPLVLELAAPTPVCAQEVRVRPGIQVVDRGGEFGKCTHEALRGELEQASPQIVPRLKKLVTKQ